MAELERCQCDSTWPTKPTIFDLLVGLFRRPQIECMELDIETGKLYEYIKN